MSRSCSAPSWLARTLLLLVAALLLLVAATETARAQLTGRVLIVTSGPANKLIEEGLVRVRGELAAMGLATELRVQGSEPPARASVGTDFAGALFFERFGDWLRIQAWNPAAPVPVTQWIDASDPSVDAEVIAIRAVEALRAALLPYFRQRPEESAPPEPAERSTKPPAAAAEAVPRARSETRRSDDRVEPSSAGAPSRAAATAWVGPAVGVDIGPGSVHLGVQAGFAYGVPELSAAARVEVARANVPVRAEAGEVAVTSTAVMLDARTRIRLLEQLDAYGALGGGVVYHRVEGVAAPGYAGRTEGHTSPSLLGELGALYAFGPRLGAYLSARGTVATNAPVVRVARRAVATLDRPELAFSSGLTLTLE